MAKRPDPHLDSHPDPHPVSLDTARRWPQINRQYAQVRSLAIRGHLDFTDLALLMVLQRDATGPGDLRQVMGVSAAQISRRVAKLVALGLVAEEIDPQDLRRTRLEATTKSYNVIHEVGKALGPGVLEELYDLRNALSGMQVCLGCSELAVRVALSIRFSESDLDLILGLPLGGPLDIGQIAQICASSRSSVSSAVVALERLGLVCRLRVQGGCKERSWADASALCASQQEGAPQQEEKPNHEGASNQKDAPCRDGRFVMVSLTDEGRKAIEPWVPDLS